ncbi:hypothetical protein IIC38_03305 [candidate division KSB1 bacterium]|nr:hypothetical protein [candidate division KSB1 bacterium]
MELQIETHSNANNLADLVQNSRVPSHVHYNVSGPGYPNQNFELRFAGDPYLAKRIVARDKRQDRFNSIKEIIKGNDGIWRCNFDIKLEK